MINPIVFISSSHSANCVTKAVAAALKDHSHTVVDLEMKKFSDYDPEQKNSGDDFLAMAEQMVQHQQIILASPVYWYSVPAIMKRFIDRWGDLLDGRKDIARKLQGKDLLLIAPYGTYPDGMSGYEDPLKKLADYMSMNYKGCFFYYTGNNPKGMAENQSRLEQFRAQMSS